MPGKFEGEGWKLGISFLSLLNECSNDKTYHPTGTMYTTEPLDRALLCKTPPELKQRFPGIMFTEVIPNVQYKDQNENVYGKFEGLWKMVPKTKYLKEPTTG